MIYESPDYNASIFQGYGLQKANRWGSQSRQCAEKSHGPVPEEV